MYSYGPLHMAEQKQGDQLEPTYSSSVWIRGVVMRTCWKRWTMGERGSGISVQAARHDDDDDDDARKALHKDNVRRYLRPMTGGERNTAQGRISPTISNPMEQVLQNKNVKKRGQEATLPERPFDRKGPRALLVHMHHCHGFMVQHAEVRQSPEPPTEMDSPSQMLCTDLNWSAWLQCRFLSSIAQVQVFFRSIFSSHRWHVCRLFSVMWSFPW